MSLENNHLQLSVDALLDVEIDGQPASIRGEGQHLWFVLDRQETFQHLFDGHLSYASALADQLSRMGLTLTVIEDQQPLIRMGRGVSSPLSRLITGSSHISAVNFAGLVRVIRVYLASRR
jgi:hypothetical protein